MTLTPSKPDQKSCFAPPNDADAELLGNSAAVSSFCISEDKTVADLVWSVFETVLVVVEDKNWDGPTRKKSNNTKIRECGEGAYLVEILAL